MTHSSYESAGSPRSVGELVANQRPGYSFERPLYTDVGRWCTARGPISFDLTFSASSLAEP